MATEHGPNPKELGLKPEGTAETAREQAEAVRELSVVSTKLAEIQLKLDKWGEPADKELLGPARKAL